MDMDMDMAIKVPVGGEVRSRSLMRIRSIFRVVLGRDIHHSIINSTTRTNIRMASGHHGKVRFL